VPEVSSSDLKAVIEQVWPPMFPLDSTERHKQLVEKLREGGMSIETFLSEDGREDVEQERKRILDWLSELSDMDAKAKAAAQPKETGNDVRNKSKNRTVQRRRRAS